MTARTALVASSLALAVASAGCLTFYEVQIETPIRAKLDVSQFQRVLVAGFLAGGTKNLDPNTETARLVRSQLRNKSDMRVLDADVIDLIEEMDKRIAAAAAASATPTPSPSPSPNASPKPGEEPLKIRDEKDLAIYEPILKDEEFWKKIGGEYPDTLIITGSILFAEVARSGMVTRLRSYTDSMGRPQYEDIREFANMRGYSVTPKFVFIDGRTGAQIHTEAFFEEALYNEGTNTPALSSYFELMDKLMPGLLNTLSTQRIRGTRVLLLK
jgi:hypothetical protein